MTDSVKIITDKKEQYAWYLSLAGFIPFALLALSILIIGNENNLFPTVLDLFKIWAAIILAFLGGIRWGIAIMPSLDELTGDDTTQNNWMTLIYSVIPSILGWIALVLPDIYCISVLLICFCCTSII